MPRSLPPARSVTTASWPCVGHPAGYRVADEALHEQRRVDEGLDGEARAHAEVVAEGQAVLRQAAVLVAYLRSAHHMGSVLLLAAAMLLPLAQAGQFLAGVTRPARTSLTMLG